MNYTALDRKYTNPKVLILDDNRNAIENTKKLLENEGYMVKWVGQEDAAYEYLKNEICPIAIIDLELVDGEEGLKAAKKCVSLQPHDSLRICNSGYLTKKSIKNIKDSFTPTYNDEGLVPLHVRDIWAICDKDDGRPKDLIKLIESYRNERGCQDFVKIELDANLFADFETDFASIGWDKDLTHKEPRIQFVELVKQLANRQAMPNVESIRLTKIGRGRSKTIVAQLNIIFKQGGAKSTKSKEQKSIIKIGRLNSIKDEVRNFKRIVPEILSSVSYPDLETIGCSTTLAGLSYSSVANAQGIAPTLLEMAFGDEMEDFPLVLDRMNLAFAEREVTDCEDSLQRQGELLSTIYQNRFDRFESIKADLDEFVKNELKEYGETLKDGIVRSETTFSFGKMLEAEIRVPFPDIRDISAEVALMTTCHGDFHMDNILIYGEGESMRNIYIDFADTGMSHIFLDHVVMEAALRFQVIKFLHKKANGDREPLLRKILEMESLLFLNALGKGDRSVSGLFQDNELSGQASKLIERTYMLICAIRKAAYESLSRLKFVGEEDASRQFSAEEKRYFAGLGVAIISAVRLDQPDEYRETHRKWMTAAGASYLGLFNEFKSVDNGVKPNSIYGQSKVSFADLSLRHFAS